METGWDLQCSTRTTKKSFGFKNKKQIAPDVVPLSPKELGPQESFQLLDNITFIALVGILGIVEKELELRWLSFRRES